MTRRALLPAVVLFGILLAHSILETARDALFLARLGPQRLAWAYLAIAAGALIAVTAFRRWGKLRDPRRMLIGFLATAAVGSTVIAATITTRPSVVFVLYVWTGLVASLVVPTFWTLIDRTARISDAKRAFAVVGAGGVLGAMVGSAIGSVLGRIVDAHDLVTAGAIAFGLSTLLAVVIAPRPHDEPPPRRDDWRPRPGRYVRVIVMFVIVSTVALTLADLLFKRVMAERFAPEDLATAFGAIYAGLNVVGLAIQLIVTPRLLARLGVGGALVVLPAILVVTACGFAITGALVAIIALKVGDGGLRHSIHRVATEILYVPIPAALRDGAKPIADALGHRGGQALAALVVFGLAAAGMGSTMLAIATALAALVWLMVIASVRRCYVQQFRDTLRAGEIQRSARADDLDSTSAELLVEALASPDEHEALAALDLLTRRGGRIPALVLYHPSPVVVRHALTLLAGDRRPEVTQVLRHLLATAADPQVRACALGVASRSEDALAALGDPDVDVRAAALVALTRDPDHVDSADTGIAALCAGSTHDRAALARAIGFMPDPRFRGLLNELLLRREPAVMREVLRLLARSPELAELDRLTMLLQDAHVRGDVRRVFLALGQPGLDHLIVALDDPRTPIPVRRHIPRTISKFRSRTAAAALVARLPREPDGTTEFKILRALGRMRTDNPTLPIDIVVLRRYARRAIADAARYATIADCFAVQRGASPSGELIAELLADKRRYSIEHAFRALAIMRPRIGLRSVHDALVAGDVDRFAVAREVLEHVVRVDLRLPLLAVLDELTPAARRARLGDLAAGPFPTYEALVLALLEDQSESLRCVVAHHVAERRLIALRPSLVTTRALGGAPLVVNAFDQAIARLDA